MTNLEENLYRVRERIRTAAMAAGRNPDDITLVAVTKTLPSDTVLQACHLGVRDIGENRVLEAVDKHARVQAEIAGPVTWHMIGHLQRRQVRDAISVFDLIHSVDSVALARRIDSAMAATGRVMPVLLEVNIASESTKFGFAPEPRSSLWPAVEEIIALPHIQVQGLMTVAPIVAHPAEARPHFAALGKLHDELAARFTRSAWRHLSMGMTDDFEIAISEGATLVRVGRAIFGQRPAP